MLTTAPQAWWVQVPFWIHVKGFSLLTQLLMCPWSFRLESQICLDMIRAVSLPCVPLAKKQVCLNHIRPMGCLAQLIYPSQTGKWDFTTNRLPVELRNQGLQSLLIFEKQWKRALALKLKKKLVMDSKVFRQVFWMISCHSRGWLSRSRLSERSVLGID